MNSNDYLTNILLNNLVGMDYNGREVTEVRLLTHNESREFTDVILVRYGQEINDKIFLHPAHAKYSYLTAERILLVEYPGYGCTREFNFTK